MFTQSSLENDEDNNNNQTSQQGSQVLHRVGNKMVFPSNMSNAKGGTTKAPQSKNISCHKRFHA